MNTQAASVHAVLRQVDAGLDAASARLFDLLRIASISTQPVHDRDVRHAAEWLRDQLAELGFKVDVASPAEMRCFHRGTRSHALPLGKLAARLCGAVP